MTESEEILSQNPVLPTSLRDTFSDVTIPKLIRSWLTIFWRIYRLQGLAGAYRVIPIVWLIIRTVRGFASFHLREYARAQTAKIQGIPLEEMPMSPEESAEYKELGRWLCASLHNLGPTFIKIGQTLSTRADLLPLPAMIELAALQENVQSFDNKLAFATIERELGAPVSELYASFVETPIAAASLAQAYRAKLSNGQEVVVKVQRPNLPTTIARDLQVLEAIADEVMTYPCLCRHTDWPSIVSEFGRTIFEEIDYIREGRNADMFRANFRQFDRIHIPRIIWRLTGRRVLTIEYVPGVRVTDVEAIESQGISRDELLKIGAEFYLRQLLEDGFFHADPHPGNLRVMPDGRIGVFDFGMVGRLSPELKQHLLSGFLSTIQKDYAGLIDAFIGMGFLNADVDKELLLADMTPIIDARFAEGMTKVRFRQLLFDFSDVCYRYPFKLPTEFTFVMRALLTLEGVALTIKPSFNFIEAAMPFAHRLLLKNNQIIGQSLIKEIFNDGRFNRQAAVNLLKAAASLLS